MFDSCRFVWNTALGRWNDLWRHEGLTLTWVDMSAELTDWRGRFDWLAAVPRRPQKETIRDLNRAITAFYAKKSLRPRYKRKGSVSSATWDRDGFSLQGQRLHVAVAGHRTALRVVLHRPMPGPASSVVVSRDAAGLWWASFVVRVPTSEHQPTGRTTGLDVGLRTFATTEDTEHDIANPHFGRRGLVIQRRRDRALSRSQEASKRRTKAQTKRARAHAKVANQRRHHAHENAARLAAAYDRIGVERLRISNLRRGRPLARSISDVAWGQFVRTLDWHMKKTGRELDYRPARNTSKTCSDCGAVKAKLALSERLFTCEACGVVIDRDRNAARNLNPGRDGPGVPVDGSRTLALASVGAARGTESCVVHEHLQT